MANPEHLKILEKGVDHWNKWRKENPKIKPDLSVAVLVGADLRKADLRKADFRLAILIGANLGAAILNEANFWEANLRKADFRKADFRRAELSRANLNEANLMGVNLRGANLNEADLSEANLWRADLREVNISKADLFKSNFSNCELNDVNFSGAVFGHTQFNNVDLSNVHGLSETEHLSQSYIDIETFYKSQGNIPVDFLRKAGIPEDFIKHCLPSIKKNPIEFCSSFISCSEKDISFARRLSDTLQERGIRCWLYKKDLKISDKLDKNIIEAIRREDKFILCMSRYSLKSSWVEKEIRTALAKEKNLSKKEKDVVVLIPIDIDGFLFSDNCTNIFKEELENRLAAKFEGWELDNTIFDREVEKVIEALRINRGLYDKPPEPKL